MGQVPFWQANSLPFGWTGVNLPFGLGTILERGADTSVVEHELLHNEPGGKGRGIFESLTSQQQLSFKWSYLAKAPLDDAVAIQDAFANVMTPFQRAGARIGLGGSFIFNEMKLKLGGGLAREVFPTLYNVGGNTASGIPIQQRGFYADTFKMSAFAGPNVNKRRYSVIRR
jgi:hypothetical protein